MKNLKKVLALVLVVATLMSFATVASAAFTDAKDIDYKEAVDVLYGLGVIEGYTDGSFKPEGNVTRAQMAKMVTYIVNGGEDVGDLYAGANVFSDCTTNWAKGYIAYANKIGIVAGIGGGKFNPNGSVTGTQAAKMMLVALGYDSAIEGYTGTGWDINVLADARDAGLLENLDGIDMSKALTREQAAQLMLNTLTASIVDYDTKGTNVTINGAVIATGASKAEAVTWKGTEGKDYTNADGLPSAPGETVEFCEKYFPKLYHDNTSVNGQKGYTWKLQGQTDAVSSFIATETVVATSTNGTSITDLTTYNTTNSKFAVKVDFTKDGDESGATYKVYVNGAEVGYKTNAEATDLTAGNYYFATDSKKIVKATNATTWGDINGNGVKIDFVDTDDNTEYAEKIYVTVYDVKVVSKAPVVKTNTATGKDEVTINGLSITNVETSKVTGYEGLVKDDVVTVVKMADGTYTIKKLDAINGQATAEDANGTLTVNGTAIKVAKNADSSFSAYSAGFYKDVTFYCDEYGYGVYAKAVTTDSTDYLMVIENGEYSSSNVTSASNKSYVVLADGTTATIDVEKVGDVSFGDSSFVAPITGVVYSYTVNSDNTYNLTAKSNAYVYNTSDASDLFQGADGDLFSASNDGDGDFNKGVSAMSGTVYVDTASGTTGAPTIKGNADTVYVLRDVKTANTNAHDTTYKSTWTAYTGYANVKGVNAASLSAVIGSDGYADVVFIYYYKADAVTADTSDYVYITSTTTNTVYKADGSVDYYTLNAIVDGEVTTVKADSTTAGVLDNGQGLYIVEYTEGKATSATPVAGTAFDSANKYRYGKVTSLAEPEAGMIVASGVSYSYTDECAVYEIAADGTVTETDVFGYEAIASGNIYLVNNNAEGSSTANADINTLTEIYIQK